jgi:hypothetical protein
MLGFDVFGVLFFLKGGDGANVHRVFVQHTPTKITSKNREEVDV